MHLPRTENPKEDNEQSKKILRNNGCAKTEKEKKLGDSRQWVAV